MRNQYIFNARVVDSGNPSLTGLVLVTVNVTDLNDNIPLFVEQVYRGVVVEGQSGIPVIKFGTTNTNLQVQVSLHVECLKFFIFINNINIVNNIIFLVHVYSIDSKTFFNFNIFVRSKVPIAS